MSEEAITVEQALRGYTLGGAYSTFEEHEKGSLSVGKVADFVVLSQNPFEIAPDVLSQIRVLSTVVGGEVVFWQNLAP